MSARGELVTFRPPLAGVGAALSGEYTVAGAGGSGLEVRDTRQKLVCRIAVLAVPGGSFWLTLAPLRGYDADRRRIARSLTSAGFLREEGWKSAEVPMAAGERADAAVVRVLLRLREIQSANLPGALAGTHVEFLHDFRVAIRRTRTVMREMRSVFPAVQLEQLRASFKWLQDQTSATRDLDVYLEDFNQLRLLAPDAMRADLEPLELLLRRRLARARAVMELALASERARALDAQWAQILPTLVSQSEVERPAAACPIAALAGERIRRVHRRMVRMGRAIARNSEPERYHELRKQGKELRYLLELFGARLFDDEAVQPMVTVLRGLQDVLGLHQDREVQRAMLQHLAGELVSQPGGAGALMAIGTLIERLDDEAHAARRRFAASYAEFASEAQCKLVTKAFR